MLRFLIEKEFKLIRRDSILPKLIIIMPVMMMILLPFAANLEVKNINLAVVDNDRSTFSTNLVEKIGSSGYFHIYDYTETYAQAMTGVDAGAVDVILDIPYNFEAELANGAMPSVLVAANAVNATKAGMGSSYLMSIIQGYVVEKSPQKPMPNILVSSQNRFNPLLNYKFYMVPALMVMLLTIMCGFLPAMNIVSEKESGTIEQMNVTPVGKYQFIFAKIAPYWIIGFAVLTICLLIAFLFYGLVAVGSYATIYLSAALFLVTISGLGLLISNYSATLQQAMFVMFFFVLIMILLSGLFTPVQSMPQWAQNITLFNPLRYFIQIMRGVYLKGSNLADITPQLLSLGAFAVVLYSWAIVSYRKLN